jgi:hypothetical protein
LLTYWYGSEHHFSSTVFPQLLASLEAQQFPLASANVTAKPRRGQVQPPSPGFSS